MTPVAEFTRSVNIAAMPFTDKEELTFSFGGQPIQLGSLISLGDRDVKIRLAERDLNDPRLSRVLGLICFLADVRGVNLLVDLDLSYPSTLLDTVGDMLEFNGFVAAMEDANVDAETWVRLSRSIAR